MGAIQFEERLHLLDYALFAVTFLFSIAIGIYYAIRDKHKTTDQYLLADRKLHVIPTALSLAITLLSANTILGDATETYFFGINYFLYVIASLFSMILVATVIVPMLHPLRITSVQQYVMMRYQSRPAVYISNLFQILMNLLCCGTYLLGPAFMMFAVSGIPVWLTILVVGLISTLYSTAGGFKGVIWTDVFQAVVVIGALVTIAIKGTSEVGGVSAVLSRYQKVGGLDIIYEMNPMNRMDFGTMVFIHIIPRITFYGTRQPSVQRFCSMSSLKDAQGCVLLAIPVVTVIAVLAGYGGVVAFSYYSFKGCDPFRAGYINNPNQILPFYVVDVLDVPGIPGLFIACVFCGSLSSLSSDFISASAMTWEDILRHRQFFSQLDDKKKAMVTKVSVAIAGTMSTLTGLVLINMEGSLIKVVIIVLGPLFTGGFLMVFLGACFPRCNGKSAIFGAVMGFGVTCWLAVGTVTIPPQYNHLPTTVTNCSSSALSNLTSPLLTTDMDVITPAFFGNQSLANISGENVNALSELSSAHSTALITGIHYLYKVSPMWHSPIGVVVGIVFCLISTLLPGFSVDHVDEKYILPCVRCLLKFGKKRHVYHKANSSTRMDGIINEKNNCDEYSDKTTHV